MLSNLLTKIWDTIDQRGVVRRLVLGITVYMTYTASNWAMAFADHTARSGIDTAAIIGAATGPLVALQAFAFKAYLESRNGDNEKAG